MPLQLIIVTGQSKLFIFLYLQSKRSLHHVQTYNRYIVNFMTLKAETSIPNINCFKSYCIVLWTICKSLVHYALARSLL
jgi:hypothetical protein